MSWKMKKMENEDMENGSFIHRKGAREAPKYMK